MYREYPEVGSLQVIEVAPPLTIEAQLDHFRASKLFDTSSPIGLSTALTCRTIHYCATARYGISTTRAERRKRRR